MSEWGNPYSWRLYTPQGEITRGTETSKYPEENKTISDSASSGERTRISPNHRATVLWGCRTEIWLFNQIGTLLEHVTIEGESPVQVPLNMISVSWVGRGRWNPVWIYQHHLERLNITERPIVNQYCEGKVKRTLWKGVKSTWNRTLTSGRSLYLYGWLRAFCIMSLRVTPN